MTRIGKRIESVSQRTMEQLLAYRWPGNIRELENVLERAVILETDRVLEIDPGILPATGAVSPIHERPSLETAMRDHISSVLDETNWVIEGPRGAAKILGLHPNTLRHRLKKLGIEPPATAGGSRHHRRWRCLRHRVRARCSRINRDRASLVWPGTSARS